MAYRDLVLSKNPLAYWRLGDAGSPALDSGPNGLSLALAAGVATGVTGALVGDSNNAMHFDGISGSAAANFSSILNPATIALSLWVKPDGSGITTIIVDSAQFGTFKGYRIQYLSSGRVQLVVGNGTTTISTPNVAAALLATGVWQHLGVVSDGVNSYVYINGLLATSIAAVLVPSTASKFALGSVSLGTSLFWPGAEDEVAVFASLTAQDMIDLYMAGLSYFESAAISAVGDFEVAPQTSAYDVVPITLTSDDGIEVLVTE